MDYKSYRFFRIAITVILSVIIGQAIIFENYILATISMISAMAIILAMKKKVKGVIADERDYAIAGKSARYAMSVFSFISVILMFFFISNKHSNPVFEPMGYTLAYSVCVLMLIYSALFYFYEKQN